MRSETGLEDHNRHPLTYSMEAADDIAYATGDIEDVLKKGFVDFNSIRDCLKTAENKESKDCVENSWTNPTTATLRG